MSKVIGGSGVSELRHRCECWRDISFGQWDETPASGIEDKSVVTVVQILELIESDVVECMIGDGHIRVEPASNLTAGLSSFCYDSAEFSPVGDAINLIVDRPIGLVIVPSEQMIKYSRAINWVSTENPRYLFAKICSIFFPRRNGWEIGGIATPSGVCVENSGVYIGSEAHFERGFSGSGVKIFPGVTILAGTFIRSGTVLGSDGFGFERRTSSSHPIRLQHYGGLIIGQNCEIGSNVSIDRGTFEDTVIGDDVKVDNNVHIAHNVTIGKGTMIVAGSVISGSASIGAFVWLGPNVTVKNKVRIGDSAHVSLGSVVLKDVKPGQRVFGNPARVIS